MGGTGETGLSSTGIYYGNPIALSGIMERRGRGHAGEAESSVMLMLFSWKEEKSSLKYSVTRAVLWFGEIPKSCYVGDGGFVLIQLMWRQIGVHGKRLASGCWGAL